jgi:hypothetical protein
MDNTTRKYKVQKIVEGATWVYVGNAYLNKNGTLSIQLDKNATLSGGDKLYVKPAREKTEAEAPPAG